MSKVTSSLILFIMHLNNLFLLGLSAGALSLSTSPSTSSSLDKRFSYGWIGAFNEPTCSKVDYSGFLTRPELHKGVCTQFTAGTDGFVGINWGAGENHRFSALQAYNDSWCEYPLAEIKNSEGKAGDCVNLWALGTNGKKGDASVWYGNWSSVRAVS